jgi:hypothetical protein
LTAIIARVTKSEKEGFVRLGVGVVLNACLWPLTARLGKDYGPDARLAVISVAVAVTALVSVIPIFWRGKPWQAPIAFVLLWQPALDLYAVISYTFSR